MTPRAFSSLEVDPPLQRVLRPSLFGLRRETLRDAGLTGDLGRVELDHFFGERPGASTRPSRSGVGSLGVVFPLRDTYLLGVEPAVFSLGGGVSRRRPVSPGLTLGEPSRLSLRWPLTHTTDFADLPWVVVTWHLPSLRSSEPRNRQTNGPTHLSGPPTFLMVRGKQIIGGLET